MHFARNSALAGLAVIPLAFAQTYTTCNPMEKSCPNDIGLDSASFACDFTQGKSALASWSTAAGTSLTYDGSKGAQFVINGKNQAPTISSDFYIFFGRVDVKMQAAPGVGIVSSMVLQSEDLDEIDWEWLGGDGTQAQTNYFGKGNTTSYDRGTYQSVSSPQTIMHTYSFDWTKDKIDWLIDGVIVRTLMYADAVGGENFPRPLCASSWATGLLATRPPTPRARSSGLVVIRTSPRLLSPCTSSLSASPTTTLLRHTSGRIELVATKASSWLAVLPLVLLDQLHLRHLAAVARLPRVQPRLPSSLLPSSPTVSTPLLLPRPSALRKLRLRVATLLWPRPTSPRLPRR
jgi:hypothetical protein